MNSMVWINWCINTYHFHFDFKLQLRLPFPGPSTQWPTAPRLRHSWRCGHGIKSVDKTEKKTPPDFTVKFDTASAAFTTTFTVKGNHSPQMLRQLQRPFTALLTGSWWTKLASCQGIRSLASRNVAADDDNPVLHQWCFPLAWQVHSSIKMWQSAYSLLVFLDTYISSSWCLFGAWQQQVHQWQIPCVSPLSAFVLTKSAFAANIARTRMKRPRFVWSAFSKWFSWCRDAQESFTS